MRTHQRANISVNLLDSRALLSGFGHFTFTPPPPPDAAVLADIAKIKTDTTAFMTEFKTLAPTLKTDEMAVQTAIQAAIKNDTTVQTAQATLKTEITTAQTTIQADFKAIMSATTSTARQAAIAQLKSDYTTLGRGHPDRRDGRPDRHQRGRRRHRRQGQAHHGRGAARGRSDDPPGRLHPARSRPQGRVWRRRRHDHHDHLQRPPLSPVKLARSARIGPPFALG